MTRRADRQTRRRRWHHQAEANAWDAWRNAGPPVRRWIGAARRRAARKSLEQPADGAQIITLSWAQTFGRPTTPKDARLSDSRDEPEAPATLRPRSCA